MAEKSLGTLVINIEARLGKLEASLKQAEQRGEAAEGKLNSAFNKVGGALAAAFATEKIIQFAKEAVQLAAKVEGIETAFRKLNNPGLLSQLRSATKNTVSDWQLMQKAVQASNFKIPLDTLAAGLEFAHMRAIATGQSIDYLVDSLVTGLGRKSAPILDNLGISMVELQEETSKVGDFATAAMNIMRRELEKTGGVTDTTVDKMARLNAEIENQKVQIGKGLTPVYHGLLYVLNAVIKGTTYLYDSTALLREEMARLNEEHVKYGNMLMNTYQKTTNGSKETIETLATLEQQLENLKKVQKETDIKSKAFADNKKKIIELQNKINKLTEDEKDTAKELNTLLNRFYDEMKFRAKEYYDFKLQMINKEYEEYKKAGIKTVELEKWKAGQIERLQTEALESTTKRLKPTGPDIIPPLQGPKNIFNMTQVRVPDNPATKQIAEDFEKMANEVQKYSNIAANAFGSFTDLLVIQARTGASAVEKAFTNMVNQIIADLMRLAIQSAFLKLFTGIATGGASLAMPGIGVGHYGGTFQGGNKVASFAGGGEFTVPGGYPNDGFPMRVESFERVKVTPSSQVGQTEKLLAGLLGELRALTNITAAKETNVTVVNSSPDVRSRVKKDGKYESIMIREGNKIDER